MKKCYMCDESINDKNKSREHIILNALGGKLKSYNLLCNKCNSGLGDIIDSELAKQFEYITNMLNIKRDDGETPKSVRVTGIDSGDEYILTAGGKPKHLKPAIIENIEEGKIRIKANGYEQAEQIIRGKKRKYPEIDVEKELRELKEIKIRKELPEMMRMKMCFGGDDAFRSLCKSAINFYMYHNGKKDNIIHLIPFIKRESENKYISLYYPDNEILDNADSDIFHSIVVIGNPTEKILYSYIELFSFYRVIILLTDKYEGETFEKSYIYDLLNNEVIDKRAIINLTQVEVKNIVNNREMPFDKIKSKMIKLMVVAHERMDEDVRQQMIENAINNSFLKYPEGVPMTQEMFKDFWNAIEEDLVLWIAAHTREEYNVTKF